VLGGWLVLHNAKPSAKPIGARGRFSSAAPQLFDGIFAERAACYATGSPDLPGVTLRSVLATTWRRRLTPSL
jgi:hypothetical protein